jgi:hypothetical protein
MIGSLSLWGVRLSDRLLDTSQAQPISLLGDMQLLNGGVTFTVQGLNRLPAITGDGSCDLCVSNSGIRRLGDVVRVTGRCDSSHGECEQSSAQAECGVSGARFKSNPHSALQVNGIPMYERGPRFREGIRRSNVFIEEELPESPREKTQELSGKRIEQVSRNVLAG